jgi:hypothetical protein
VENKPLPRNVERRQGVNQAGPAQGPARCGWEAKPLQPAVPKLNQRGRSATKMRSLDLRALWCNTEGFLFAIMPGKEDPGLIQYMVRKDVSAWIQIVIVIIQTGRRHFRSEDVFSCAYLLITARSNRAGFDPGQTQGLPKAVLRREGGFFVRYLRKENTLFIEYFRR